MHSPRPPLRRLLALLTVALAAASLAACTSDPPGPDAAANTFLRALASGDVRAAGAATDRPPEATAAIEAARTALKPDAIETRLEQMQTTGDTATGTFSATWKLPHARTWTYTGHLALGRTKNAWSVRWSNTDLHPKLAANQTLALRVDDAPTASVLDRTGEAVLSPGVVVKVVLDPAAAGNVPAVATSLAAALSRFDPSITAQSIVDGAARANAANPYPVLTLREGDYQSVKDAIYGLPGVSFPTEARLLSTDRSFAPTVVSQVQRTVDEDLAGKAAWRVVTVSPNGAQIDTLSSTPAEPAPAVRLSLDRGVQAAAQNAVNRQQLPAVTVAMQASTGQLLAVAQNPQADSTGAIALTGLYPAGSTFKIITAAAALQAGIATADSPSQCPSSTVIGGVRTIPNYNMFALGPVPLRSAFAASCNTTFAQLSATLPADALSNAAAQLGIGLDYNLRSITTVTGKVPAAPDLVKRAEDAIGQGDVQVSPFGMALVAASVARGSTPLPVLVQDSTTTVRGQAPPLPQPVLDQLRLMMRQVVTGGSAIGVDSHGAVFGKTGEAQFGDGTNSHSWFVGYRGDVAFATLIVGGGSSGYAVGMSGQFLGALPPGY